MKPGRFTSGCLLGIWLLLSIAPAGIAFQDDHCLICNHKSCPMKKMTQPSCHEKNQSSLKFEACHCQKHDTIMFTFHAVMPDVNFESHEVVALLPKPFLFFPSQANSQTDTPPPKIQQA